MLFIYMFITNDNSSSRVMLPHILHGVHEYRNRQDENMKHFIGNTSISSLIAVLYSDAGRNPCCYPDLLSSFIKFKWL